MTDFEAIVRGVIDPLLRVESTLRFEYEVEALAIIASRPVVVALLRDSKISVDDVVYDLDSLEWVKPLSDLR